VGVQHLDVEEGFVERVLVVVVGLAFGVVAPGQQVLLFEGGFLVAFAAQGLLGLAEEGAQRLQLFVEYGADGMLHDVLDDVVGGVVAAGGLTLAAVVLQVDGSPRQGFIAAILAAPLFEDEQLLSLRLGVWHGLFGLLALDDSHDLRGDAQLEFEQALVDAAELAHAQALVVDEGQVVAFLVEVARHAVEAERKLAVGYLAGGEETRHGGLR